MKIIILNLIKIYRRLISPMLPQACKFYPTCSEYMHDSIYKYGVMQGVYLGIKRLCRCNPFCKGGYDEVP